MSRNQLVEFARNFAIKYHGEQMYGVHPYVYHLDWVHSIAVKFNLGIVYEIAAYLHDILEDTDVDHTLFLESFGQEIFNMVSSVTGVGINREERRKDTIIKLQNFLGGVNLKMCDRLANMISSQKNRPKLFNKYVEEHEHYRHLFILGDSDLFNELQDLVDNHKYSLLV